MTSLRNWAMVGRNTRQLDKREASITMADKNSNKKTPQATLKEKRAQKRQKAGEDAVKTRKR